MRRGCRELWLSLWGCRVIMTLAAQAWWDARDGMGLAGLGNIDLNIDNVDTKLRYLFQVDTHVIRSIPFVVASLLDVLPPTSLVFLPLCRMFWHHINTKIPSNAHLNKMHHSKRDLCLGKWFNASQMCFCDLTKNPKSLCSSWVFFFLFNFLFLLWELTGSWSSQNWTVVHPPLSI